jgi:4-amino-4-deoxy-L-arabinose transferase-like glycosyltransferase
MADLWLDLQETFYILFGPYIAGILLPVFIAGGLVLAILMSFSRYWRKPEKVEIARNRDE